MIKMEYIKKLVKLVLAILFGAVFLMPSFASATSYYIDLSAAAGGNGLATTTPFNSLDAFAEVSRSAGDIAFVRRGSATTTSISDLGFTSDGTLNSPIVISSDDDNLWSDFATSTQTYTPVQGTKTMTASAAITGIAANDWVYVVGDCVETYNTSVKNPCEYMYEVASVSETTLTLYLPYLGGSTAAGSSLRVMPDAPVWGTTTSDFQWVPNGDHNWYIRGIELRSTDAICAISFTTANNWVLENLVIRADGATSCGLEGSFPDVILKTSRMFSVDNALGSPAGIIMANVLIDCNNEVNSDFMSAATIAAGRIYELKDLEVINCTNFAETATNQAGGSRLWARNLRFNNTYTGITANPSITFFFEDIFSMVGLGKQFTTNVDAVGNATTTQSSSDNLRSGGGPVNSLVQPPSGTGNTGISTQAFPLTYIKLFEYPIYTNTTSKTYTMYFNSTSTGGWTNDPTADELWIECEYYPVNSITNANRVIKKSTSLADFNGSTTWQALSVTCAPAQAGILYLRGWYAKPKETPSNWFYVDLTPVIS